MPWTSPPTLYKARNVPTKQPVCAICVDRTRGRTQRVIANELGVSQMQVSRMLREALTTLRAVLEPSGGRSVVG